jgi:hypothetical protein
MKKPLIKKVDFGEYLVLIKYYGNGKIDIEVLDEIGDIIEGVYIHNAGDDNDYDFDFNLN